MAMKILPVEGEDGRLYFSYRIGDKWSMLEKHEQYFIEIVNCHLVGEVQYYNIKRTSNGKSSSLDMTANRLHYLLNFFATEQITVGKQCEFPLRSEDVEKYFKGLKSEYIKANKEAVDKLKKTPEFVELTKKRQELIPDLGKAEAMKSPDYTELRKQYDDIQERRRQIVLELNISPETLRPLQVCKECEGKGVIHGNQICQCALNRVDEIRAWNARKRLIERYKEQL